MEWYTLPTHERAIDDILLTSPFPPYLACDILLIIRTILSVLVL